MTFLQCLTRMVEDLKAKFAAIVHTHAASDITSGTLGVARGGTGGTTALDARKNLSVPVDSSIAYVESTTATTNHAVGDYFMLGSVLMKATAAIATGETITTSKATPVTVQSQIDTLRDSVSEYTSASGTGWYAVKKNGWVIVGLEGNSLSVTQSGTTLFILPEGFRPFRYINFVFTNATKSFDGMILPNGECKIWPYGNTVTGTRGQAVFPVDS